MKPYYILRFISVSALLFGLTAISHANPQKYLILKKGDSILLGINSELDIATITKSRESGDNGTSRFTYTFKWKNSTGKFHIADTQYGLRVKMHVKNKGNNTYRCQGVVSPKNILAMGGFCNNKNKYYFSWQAKKVNASFSKQWQNNKHTQNAAMPNYNYRTIANHVVREENIRLHKKREDDKRARQSGYIKSQVITFADFPQESSNYYLINGWLSAMQNDIDDALSKRLGSDFNYVRDAFDNNCEGKISPYCNLYFRQLFLLKVVEQ